MDPETVGFGGTLAAAVLAIGAWGWKSLDRRQSRTEELAGDAMPRTTADDQNSKVWDYMDKRRGEVDRRFTTFDQTMLTKADLREFAERTDAAARASEARIMAAIQAGQRRRTDVAD